MRHLPVLRAAILTVALVLSVSSSFADEPRFEAELIFPLHKQHNHAPGIVECPNGDLLVSWYRGSGERQADDVAVFGSRRRKGETAWSEPFVMVDTPGFPDGNTALWIDNRQRLWLFWPLVIANTWESCLTKYRWSEDYAGDGCPKWKWQDDVPLKPVNFTERMTKGLDELVASRPNATPQEKLFVEHARKLIPDKLTQRLGWQTRCKPTQLPSGRILLPLYTDTFSVSLMAISDDQGETWYASEPLVGYGNIQPTVLRRDDGTLVAYMRENGPREHIRVSESKDDGLTWGEVGDSELENPGAGIDGVRLANGHWILIYNDQTKGRNKLAVSISDDEGQAWRWTRHLEDQPDGRFHYPAITQGADGTIQAVYSYFVPGGKSMKHAAFNEAWVQAGDTAGK
jgi:predicted neuraminidase